MKFITHNLSAGKITLLLVLLVVLISVLILWPFVIIFALNTLFPLLSIPYSFLTWLSVAVLNISTFGGLTFALKRIENKL